MKKLTALALALVLALSLSAAVFAEDSRDTTTTTSIAPSYTITIPGDMQVAFNALSTDFGSVQLTAAQLDPGFAVKVELNASGLLKNGADAAKTIAYTINEKDGGAFTVGYYSAAGQKTDLTIDITQAAWNAAYAGEYSDTVTFTISYISTANP